MLPTLNLVALALASSAVVASPVHLLQERENWSHPSQPAKSGSFSWQNTSHIFAFGDSYTATGYNISQGINSRDPGYTSSNGKNWIQYLSQTYNVSQSLKLYNLAYGGATIDANFVVPYLPTVQSLSDQISTWTRFFSSKPAEARWVPAETLFVVWIGINDVGNAYGWTNVTQEAFYAEEQDLYLTHLQTLASFGARNFLLLTVPPTDRSPLVLSSGRDARGLAARGIEVYNRGLEGVAGRMRESLGSEGWVGVYDTAPVFNTLLDNPTVFGYTNVTGFADAYASGTNTTTTQLKPLLPVSSYFWLNSLHPTWSVHNSLALAVSTFLGGV